MKRLPALLALVAVLMLGTAGMASATTISFDDPPLTSPYLPYPPEINGLTSMTWNASVSDGISGHLWCTNWSKDSTISFTSPTYVNSFQMNGMPYAGYDPDYATFGPMIIVAFNAANEPVGSTTVSNLDEYTDLSDNVYGWLTVEVNAADVSKLIFQAPNPGGNNPDGPEFYASIDNLVINEADPVPVPASVWLLVSGLLGLVGLRRKFTC